MRCALLLLCVVFYDCKKVKQRVDKHLWSYDDESSWPGDRCKALGGRQSPIDIKSDDVIKDFNKDFIKYGSLQFRGYDRVLVSAINNGHTVQFSTEGDVDMQPMLTGGPLKHRYRLEQVHFHWLSEHAIDGFKYPLEMHFVHVRIDLSVPEALNKRDGLAIVAIFCNVQADLEESKQVPTEEIMKYMPHLMEMGDRVSGVILDMTKLLSKEPHSYYTYMGSLTSPACNEAVIWIIFNTPLWMSDAQYNQFGKISNGQHNFRSLQKVKRQQVFMPVKAGIHTPQMIIFLERVVKIVAEFFSNVTRSGPGGGGGGRGGARAPDVDLITQVVLNRLFNTSQRNTMPRRKIFFT